MAERWSDETGEGAGERTESASCFTWLFMMGASSGRQRGAGRAVEHLLMELPSCGLSKPWSCSPLHVKYSALS